MDAKKTLDGRLEAQRDADDRVGPIEPAELLPELKDPIDGELRALWGPAPAAPPELRTRLLALAVAEEKQASEKNSTGPYDLAEARARAQGKRAPPTRAISRGAIAASGAALLLFGVRAAVIRSHHQLHANTAAHGESASANSVGASVHSERASANGELSLEDEQFAMAAEDGDEPDSDEDPSVLELAADE